MKRIAPAISLLFTSGTIGLVGFKPNVVAGDTTATNEMKPYEKFALHLDAKMHFPGDHEMIAHHYCKTVSGGMIECLIFDSEEPDAHLVGVEMIVDPATFESFSDEEKVLWHYHKTEFPKIEATLPDLTAEERAEVVKTAEETYGKVYLLWDPSVDDLPIGQPIVPIME